MVAMYKQSNQIVPFAIDEVTTYFPSKASVGPSTTYEERRVQKKWARSYHRYTDRLDDTIIWRSVFAESGTR
jgi:hypothetical protein